MPENKVQSEKIQNTPPVTVYNIKGLAMPFAVRPKTSDEPITAHIFNGKLYELKIQNKFKPKLILDCGGNIGCSAVFFTNVYPSAQIYTVEPAADNFKLLQYNSFFYKNIHPINAALWDKETYIKVTDVVGKNYLGYRTFETTEDDPKALKTVTVSKLLADSGFDEIDLLKIDVEGAEKEVFGAPDVDEWLSKVKVLIIEIHDNIKPGCSYELFKAVSKYHWRFDFRADNLIFMREDFLEKL